MCTVSGKSFVSFCNMRAPSFPVPFVEDVSNSSVHVFLISLSKNKMADGEVLACPATKDHVWFWVTVAVGSVSRSMAHVITKGHADTVPRLGSAGD